MEKLLLYTVTAGIIERGLAGERVSEVMLVREYRVASVLIPSVLVRVTRHSLSVDSESHFVNDAMNEMRPLRKLVEAL